MLLTLKSFLVLIVLDIVLGFLEILVLVSYKPVSYKKNVYSTTNAKQVGQSIRLKKFNEALASTLCENKSAVFRQSCKSIFFQTNLLCLYELWNIFFESQGEGKERGLQNSV